MNPISLQKQLRDNSSDLVDFCADLKQWGDEMKRKEALLGSEDDTTAKVPLPRNAVKKTLNSPGQTGGKRIKSWDYAAWDKYDVDVECSNIDRTDDSDSGDITDECDDNIRDEALYEKEKGNKFVKNRMWDQAIECYTKAIQCYAYDPIFYANRALCHLKKSCYREAESDCTTALQLDKTYVKAYQRRASAREALNQLSEAHDDLLKVFDYEPNNKESKAALVKLEKKLEGFNKQVPAVNSESQRPKSKFTMSRQRQRERKPAETTDDKVVSGVTHDSSNEAPRQILPYWPSGNEVELVKTVLKSPHLRSKKALKSITVSDDCTVTSKPKSFDATIKNEDLSVKQAWPRPGMHDIRINCDDLKVVEKQNVHTEDRINRKNNDVGKFNFSVPQTCVQFNYDWRLLRSQPEWKLNYLKQIDPNDFATIFKESLDCDLFSDIIRTIIERFIEKNVPVYDYLLGLSKVKRFTMLTMFMSAEDKKGLLRLFDHLGSDNKLTKAAVEDLIQKYRM